MTLGFDPWPATQVHLEWGTTGARLAAERGDAVVVVDVLSFSTSVTIAAGQGVGCLVLPAPRLAELGGPDIAAARFGVRSAASKRTLGPDQLSLSPARLLNLESGPDLLVTSLNGAAVVAAAAAAPQVLVGCVRSATAAARAAAALLAGGVAARVTVVACGEQWSTVDGGQPESGEAGLRPGMEDWVGAGLICSRLARAGLHLSAEARLAASVDADPASAIEALAQSVSARELSHRGFTSDVELAIEVDADSAVPARTHGDERTGWRLAPT
jgi:2-phosphosulfolactate phosphatase